MGDRDDIDSTVSSCVTDGLIPDAEGIDVIIAGVGRVADPESMPSETLEWLLELVETVCEASRAKSCTVTQRLLRLEA